MAFPIARIFPLLFLAPYIFGVSPADTSFDEMAVGVGAGQYAVRDCSGAHPETFRDVGIKVTHKFQSPFRVGLSITGTSRNVFHGFIYPDLAYNPKFFSIGTTGVRVGPEDNIYGELSLADQVPAFSGKGFARLGIGLYVPAWETRFWLGSNLVPYSKGGWAGQIDFPLMKNRFLFINGRYGKSSGIPEFGFSAGLRLRYY